MARQSPYQRIVIYIGIQYFSGETLKFSGFYLVYFINLFIFVSKLEIKCRLQIITNTKNY